MRRETAKVLELAFRVVKMIPNTFQGALHLLIKKISDQHPVVGEKATVQYRMTAGVGQMLLEELEPKPKMNLVPKALRSIVLKVIGPTPTLDGMIMMMRKHHAKRWL